MSERWHPVEASERYQVLDLIRGVALFGVLLVNLLYFFRVSLFAHMLRGEPGFIDRFVGAAIEFKAFDLFSLSFGIGVAVQAERAAKRGASATAFLVRRFLVLLAFGLVHITLVSNVDILCLYAVCGLALIPLRKLPWPALLVLAIAAVLLQPLVPHLPFPSEAGLRADVTEATRIYAHAAFLQQVAFRWHETVGLILPLLVSISLTAYGLMLGGMAIWKAGVIRDRGRYRRPIWIGCAVALAVWALTREHIPLAVAYGAAILGWPQSEWSKRWTAPFAAGGRMAFTNYLTQSLVFAAVFYGFGLFGRVPVGPAAAFGIVFYILQLLLSVLWLRSHRFGPFEWAWRSLTYGHRV